MNDDQNKQHQQIVCDHDISEQFIATHKQNRQ